MDVKFGIKPIFKAVCRLGINTNVCQVYDEYDITDGKEVKTGRRIAKWEEKIGGYSFAYYEVDRHNCCVKLLSGC